MKNHIKKSLEIIDQEVKKSGLSRRDIIKLSGIFASSNLLLNSTELKASNTENSSEAKGKIVIIGGGLAGISTAARLAHNLTNPDITIIEPNPISVSYQPGNILMALGIYNKDDIIYKTKNFVPQGVILLKDKAIEFNPETNTISLESGETIEYDFLVIATGLALDFASIKGLEELEEISTLSEVNKAIKLFEDNGITTIYNTFLAQNFRKQTQNLIKNSKKNTNLKAIFTHPNTPVKCEETSKSMAFILNDILSQEGVRDNINLTYYTNHSSMSPVEEYNKAILRLFDKKDLKYHLRHNLIELNIKDKIAIFEKSWNEKGEYDQDLEKYTEVTRQASVEIPFDFLHLTPPMKTIREIRTSALVDEDGYVLVDKKTLQHKKYKNIFSLGDTISAPMGKSGASIRRQYKIVAENLISLMEGKEAKQKYTGYTVCPLITDIGKVMLAEYDWTKKPTPSFPLDPDKQRYIWWLLTVYLLRPFTQYGLLSGKA